MPRIYVRFILLLSLFASPIAGQSRRALVIGNDSYPGNTLHNARNDAASVHKALSETGYVSTLVLDANHATLSKSMDTFVDSIVPGDVAVLYYAGHGFQIDGVNFLVPIDFKASGATFARREGYSLAWILERLSERGAATQIVILDACRNNPFLDTRSLGGGWASLGTSAGTFLAFGTSPGSTASDDPKDGHGLFTKDLLKYLTTSDQDIEQMFRLVREDVIKDSNGAQVPWIASSLIGSFHIQTTLDVTQRLLPNIDRDQIELSGVYNRSYGQIPGTDSGSPAAISESDKAELDRAVTLVRGARIDEAIGVLQHLISINPACAVALRLLGLLFHRAGRDLEAVKSFDNILGDNSHDKVAAAYKCAVETISGMERAVSDCYDIAVDTPSADATLLYAAALHARHDDSTALVNVKDAIAQRPTDLAIALQSAIQEGIAKEPAPR